MAVGGTFPAVAQDQLVGPLTLLLVSDMIHFISVQSSLDEMSARLSEKTHELNTTQLENDRFKVCIALLADLSLWPSLLIGLF